MVKDKLWTRSQLKAARILRDAGPRTWITIGRLGVGHATAKALEAGGYVEIDQQGKYSGKRCRLRARGWAQLAILDELDLELWYKYRTVLQQQGRSFLIGDVARYFEDEIDLANKTIAYLENIKDGLLFAEAIGT